MIDSCAITIPAQDKDVHPAMEYQRVNKNWTHGFSDEMVRQVRHVYFAMIAEVDAMVGRTLNGLREMGLEDDTTIIFTSDHGEMAMEHQQFYKMNFYEASARIPMIIAGSGIPHGVISENPVSLIDIYPTLMDLAGRQCPAGLDGHSLLPELLGGKCQRPDWVFGEYHDCTSCTGQFMLRRGDYKYIAYASYEPMLFNLAQDPDEMNNLAGSKPEIVCDMDTRLRAIVDYNAVDAKVKAYDRASFRAWREEHKRIGDYDKIMAFTFSGWDRLKDRQETPWTPEREQLIINWLNRN
jgi:arylsulfatase K